jgi:predicted DNA-binding transcriptional regulator AlpA
MQAKASIDLDALSDDTMIDLPVVCLVVGGPLSPVHPSTIYNGIAAGIYPRPMKTGVSDKPRAKGNRWRLGDWRDVLRKRLAQARARSAAPDSPAA